jgi:hypothetical protein
MNKIKLIAKNIILWVMFILIGNLYAEYIISREMFVFIQIVSSLFMIGFLFFNIYFLIKSLQKFSTND